MSTVFCTNCGQQNPQDARFCSQCGAPLARSGAPERLGDTTSTISLTGLDGPGDAEHDDESVPSEAILEGLLPGSALLVVLRGPGNGSRFLLDKDVTTAGRHPESDIFLDDVTVSRRHAEFVRDADGQGFRVRDVGSLNGTYLNKERIDDSALAVEDEVQVGKYRLVFFAAEPASGSGG